MPIQTVRSRLLPPQGWKRTSSGLLTAVPTASSVYTTYSAGRAHDGSEATQWLSNNGDPKASLQFLQPTPLKVNILYLSPVLGSQEILEFDLWGDSTKLFHGINSYVGVGGSYYYFKNTMSYRIFQLNITKNGGADTSGIFEIELYSAVYPLQRIDRKSLLTLPVARGGGF
jgi:hypothetical protein